jgi:hypothetical protein
MDWMLDAMTKNFTCLVQYGHFFLMPLE